jgi:hypothetical protein
MSFADVKEEVATMSREERLDLAAWIVHLNRKDDPEWLAEIDRRMAAMDAGKKVTQEEVERMHRELVAQGR